MYNMGKSQKHHIEKTDMKEYILCDPNYMKSTNITVVPICKGAKGKFLK